MFFLISQTTCVFKHDISFTDGKCLTIIFDMMSNIYFKSRMESQK